MRVLVTGATGVVGRRAVPFLVATGHQVTAAGRHPERLRRLGAAGADPLTLDLFDAAAVRRAVAGHDAVVNLATHIPPSARALLPGAWRENDRLRRDGAAALAEAAIAEGVGRLVQESFAPAYADGGDRWLDEDAPLRPTSYNQTVLDAERAAARVTAAGGTGVVLRFAYFYGPDARHVRDMLGMLRRGWAPLPGPPSAYVSSITHDDAATAVIAALGVPAGTYNVCDDEPLPRGEWAGAFAAAFGLAPPRPMPRWLQWIGGSTMELLSRSQRMSNRRFRAAAGWAPAVPSAREGWADVAAAMSAGGSGSSRAATGGRPASIS